MTGLFQLLPTVHSLPHEAGNAYQRLPKGRGVYFYYLSIKVESLLAKYENPTRHVMHIALYTVESNDEKLD